MRLPRPYIPLDVRLQVAARMLRERQGYSPAFIKKLIEFHLTKSDALRTLLSYGWNRDDLVQLDHDPALCNRKFNKRTGRYTPDANDPDYLVYRVHLDHAIKTRVRGDGAQLSDLAMRRKNKRIAKRILTGKRPRYGVSR